MDGFVVDGRTDGRTEPMTGIEPAYSAWEADVLPLNYIGAHDIGRLQAGPTPRGGNVAPTDLPGSRTGSSGSTLELGLASPAPVLGVPIRVVTPPLVFKAAGRMSGAGGVVGDDRGLVDDGGAVGPLAEPMAARLLVTHVCMRVRR